MLQTLQRFYHVFGPIRFCIVFGALLYITGYGAFLYYAAVRRSLQLRRLGVVKGPQACVNEDFSNRLSRREPLMLMYVAAFVIFIVVGIVIGPT